MRNYIQSKSLSEKGAPDVSAIDIEHITREFAHRTAEGKMGRKTAVNDLTFSVAPGEIFGLLGPNGAGKTTTIRMLTMQLHPTSGSISYGRLSTDHDTVAIKKLIGIVPQHVNFDQDLTVGENMELHARLHHLGRSERRARIEELLDFVELREVVNDGVRRLSGGMKRRLLIARALIHRPQVLFLDEPTVALDPQVRRRIWQLIRHLAREGVTVFLTTHYIEEAELLCDRVAMLSQGKLVDLDTPQAYCERLGAFTVEWQQGEERSYRFFPSRHEARDFVAHMGEADEAEVASDDVHVRRTNLEDAFIELTGSRKGL